MQKAGGQIADDEKEENVTRSDFIKEIAHFSF